MKCCSKKHRKSYSQLLPKQEKKYDISVVLVGPHNSGKSTIFRKFVFNEPSCGSSSVDFGGKALQVDGTKVDLKLADFCGADFKFGQDFVRKADVALLVARRGDDWAPIAREVQELNAGAELILVQMGRDQLQLSRETPIECADFRRVQLALDGDFDAFFEGLARERLQRTSVCQRPVLLGEEGSDPAAPYSV